MNYDCLQEIVRTTRDTIAKAKDELKQAAGQHFIAALQDIFTKYEIKTISWQQYTPYFNDGEECTFRCYRNADNIKIDGQECWDREKTDPMNQAYKDIAKILSKYKLNEYLEYFGDHAEVILAPTSLTVAEYEHE